MSVDAVVASTPDQPLGQKRKQKAKGKGHSTRSEDRPPTLEPYKPVPIVSNTEMAEIYTACLATADQVFQPEMCTNPLPALAAVMAVLSESEQNPKISAKG